MTKPEGDDDTRMPLASKDVVEERLDSLRQLFPEVFVDGKVDVDRLKTYLGEAVEEGPERYGLSWVGKSEAIQSVKVPSVGTLVPVPEESLTFNSSENVVIEGDNLEVLKLLQRAYYGKVKLIYIDPPYNTGNDFIYPDNFREGLQDYLRYSGQVDDEGYRTTTEKEVNGRYHARWLSMMYPRLFLARNLLRSDGAIFVNIDENEVHNLRHLLDEIFGPENFVANVVWHHTQQSKNDEPHFSRQHNQILCYRRSSAFPQLRRERTEEDNKAYSNPDGDPKGDWRSGDVRSPNLRQTLRYEVVTPSGKKIPPPENGWRWSQKVLDEKVASGEIVFADDETRIVRKIYLCEQEGRVPENLWSGKQFGTTRDANRELKALFGRAVFDTPKPTNLIKYILKLVTSQDDSDLVLDFFAGSGSTGDAVYRTNAEDSGNRRFILVQLPEETNDSDFPKITDITKARLKRSAESIEARDVDLGYRLFRLTSSNFKIWDASETPTSEDGLGEQLQLYADHVLPDRGEQDILYEIVLKSGIQLSHPIEQLDIEGATVYSVEDGKLLICLASPISREVLRAMIDREPEQVRCLDKAFEGNDQLKANTVLEMRSHDIKFQTV